MFRLLLTLHPSDPSTFFPLTHLLVKHNTVMEKDRQQADLGPDVSADMNGEVEAPRKQPKKRFIGRRAAAEKAAARGETTGGIEDSGAIQGAGLDCICL